MVNGANWKTFLPSIPTIIMAFISGFGGGIMAMQSKISNIENRVTVVETREIEYDRGAEERRKAILDVNKSLTELRELIYLHELQSDRREKELRRLK